MLDHGYRRTRPLIRWLAAAALSLAASLACAGTATLSWTPPTEYTDGAPLEVAGYRLFERCGADAYGTPIAVPAPASTYTRTGLPDGTTCWWQLTALDALGVESERSVEVFKAFPVTGEAPGAPGSLVVTWLGQVEPPAEPPEMDVVGSPTHFDTHNIGPIVLSKPTGVASGDVLFAFIKTSGGITAAPSGWDLLGTNRDLTASASYWMLYSRIAGGSEPDDYEWSASGYARSGGTLIAYRGDFDTADPIDVVSETDYTDGNTTNRAASMVVGAENSPLVFFGGVHASTSVTQDPPTSPATFVEDLDVYDPTAGGSRFGRHISRVIWSGSGATGNIDATISVSTAGKTAFAVALNPDGGGPVTLTVQDAGHSHSVDNVALTQAGTLTVADALHAHAVDSPALTQAHLLTVADALHSHAVDAVALSQANTLSVADAVHAHAVDGLVLTVGHVLSVQDAVHAHTADSVALVQSHILAVADALHAHSVDNVSLSAAGTLTIADAVHAHAVDSVALTQANVLVVQSTDHGHAVDNVVLSESQILAVADALHAHAVDAVALTQAHVLAIHDAAHGHVVDAVALTQASVLVVDDALHAHLADAVTLRLPGSLGAATLFVVQAADRVLVVAPSQRYFTVH